MKIKDGFVLRKVAGNNVVINIGGNTDLHGMMTLNETGVMIFELISAGKTEDEIVDAICSEYDIDRETATSDLARYLKALRDAGVVE